MTDSMLYPRSVICDSCLNHLGFSTGRHVQLESLGDTHQSGEVNVVLHHSVVRSRRRNLVELYVRAYWKTYSLALAWVIMVQILISAVVGR